MPHDCLGPTRSIRTNAPRSSRAAVKPQHPANTKVQDKEITSHHTLALSQIRLAARKSDWRSLKSLSPACVPKVVNIWKLLVAYSLVRNPGLRERRSEQATTGALRARNSICTGRIRRMPGPRQQQCQARIHSSASDAFHNNTPIYCP